MGNDEERLRLAILDGDWMRTMKGDVVQVILRGDRYSLNRRQQAILASETMRATTGDEKTLGDD